MAPRSVVSEPRPQGSIGVPGLRPSDSDPLDDQLSINSVLHPPTGGEKLLDLDAWIDHVAPGRRQETEGRGRRMPASAH